jgi:IclR family transcriptional regulator, pca regulon regulatory protein
LRPILKRLRSSARPMNDHGEGAQGSRPSKTLAPRPALSSSSLPSEGGDPNFMTSLARGLAVICAFSHHQRGLTIPQISKITGLSRATVRRCLYTLGKLGYVSSNHRSFELEPKILELGQAYLSSGPLATAAQPILDRLCHAVRESCSVAILDRDDVLYVARAATKLRIISVDLGVGSRLPAYCTSMGRVLLAYQADARLREYFARAELLLRTKRTITSPAKRDGELTEVKKKGYCIVDQELEIGLRSIAVPVVGKSGAVIRAMNVGTQAARVSMLELRQTIYPRLKVAAQQLSAILRQHC